MWRPPTSRTPPQTAAQIARLLGRDDEAERYETLSAAVVDAWRREFLTAAGDVRPETQANLVRALTFGLVPDEHRQRTGDRLAELVRDNGTHLATGFLATPSLLPALADAGHLDVAYDLLFQDSAPSWMTMIDRGATTMWERWEGVDDDGVPHDSLNHYSKGARDRLPAPVRRGHPAARTDVPPLPGAAASRRRAHLGPGGARLAARAARRLVAPGGEVFELSVTVPPGCTAEVVLPSGETHTAGPGTHHWVSESPAWGVVGCSRGPRA